MDARFDGTFHKVVLPIPQAQTRVLSENTRFKDYTERNYCSDNSR